MKIVADSGTYYVETFNEAQRQLKKFIEFGERAFAYNASYILFYDGSFKLASLGAKKAIIKIWRGLCQHQFRT